MTDGFYEYCQNMFYMIFPICQDVELTAWWMSEEDNLSQEHLSDEMIYDIPHAVPVLMNELDGGETLIANDVFIADNNEYHEQPYLVIV